METSEKKFRDWCKKNKLFVKKFNTHTIIGYGNKQESDFLVVGKNTYLVEVKEVKNKENIFDTNRFTQYRKMKLAERKNVNMKLYLLIYYITKKKILLLNLKDYDKLKQELDKRVIFYNDILDKLISYKDLNNFIY